MLHFVTSHFTTTVAPFTEAQPTIDKERLTCVMKLESVKPNHAQFLENILPSTYFTRCLKSQNISTQVSRFSSQQLSRRETPPCLFYPLAGPSLPGSSSDRSCTEAFCPLTPLVLGRGLRRLSSSRRPDRQSVGAGGVRAVDLGMIMVMKVVKMMMTICWSSRREGGGPC